MSSTADDFDVRYRDTGTAGYGQPAAGGGYRGSAGHIDYDLGYDAKGWDTQGFRRPELGYLAGAGPADAQRQAPGHARAAAAETSQLSRGSGTAGGFRPAAAPGRGGTGGPGGFGGPGGPRRPRGPQGFRSPGHRGFDRSRVKIKGSWWRHWTWRKAVGVLLAVTGAFVVLGAVTVVMAYDQTPVPTAAMAATAYSQSVVYSKDGTLIGRFGNTNRQMLTYDQIRQSKWLVDAVLAAEDRNFFNEGGVSPTGIFRAAYDDLRGSDGSLQGGSTITQEFVRQYYAGIGTQQTLSRKIKEIFVAIKVAKEKSKPWILTNYLNTIYLGDGAYGIGAAAETYFNEQVKNLTAAQAAVLAAIIQQPSTYPLPQYRAQLEARWRYVLNGMVQMGSLSAQQAAAMKFPVPGDFIPQRVGKQIWDPYVLNMVYNELLDVYHFNQSQIYNGGYVIRTSIDDAKMAALYQAIRDNEALIDASGVPFDPTYMHAGAVLENPANGEIEALYPGPGYPGAKYNGTGRVITKGYCKKIACEVNMAVYNREQVGSSFKPYILATAVKQGMNVQTSLLNGYNNMCIAPDTQPLTYSAPTAPTCQAGWYPVHNDNTGENGPYTPQMAMAASINTAYADLWHRVAGTHGASVVSMAQAFGVNTDAAGITAGPTMEDQAGTALGQGSLTVGEQATMLATIDDNGIYHNAHVVTSIAQNNGPPTPIKIASYPVFSTDPALNAEEATQVQYAMSEDTAPYGTAPTAGLSNGEEMIAKTGTTNTAQSAFFIGAIPSQSLAVALFTNQQGKGAETLNGLGGNSQGGFGGTWPAAIWHSYAEAMFVPLGVEQFTPPTFTGMPWNQVPPDLRIVPAQHKKHHHDPFQGPGGGNPDPNFTCDPNAGNCGNGGGGHGHGGGGGGQVNGAPVGAAAGGLFGLPAAGLWVRRRRRGRKQG